MPRSKASLITDMIGYQCVLVVVIKDAHLKEGCLDLHKDVADLPHTVLKQGHDWLRDLVRINYTAIMNIRSLLPAEIWERYEKWEDFEDHREVKLLKQAYEVFRKKVNHKDRPILFKKTYVRKLLREQKAKHRRPAN